MQEFEITRKSKQLARKRRQKKEKKWAIFRIISRILFFMWTISFLVGIFIVPHFQYGANDACATIFSISLALYVAVKAILTNLTSHWIQDRLNERIWADENNLYQFMQIAFAAGLNYQNADSTAYVHEFNIDSIRDAKYDSSSGRIEFYTDGKVIHYTNHFKGVIDWQKDLNGKHAVFYDYTKPSIYDYLVEKGVNFEQVTLDFKVIDKHIYR